MKKLLMWGTIALASITQAQVVARHADGSVFFNSAAPGESAGRVVNVQVVARHCAQYSHSMKRGHLWWKSRVTVVDQASCAANPSTIFTDTAIHNLRTTGGTDWQANAMGNSSQPASSTYLAVTNDSAAPAAGDCAAGSTTCTLASEVTTNGLARASSTYAHTNGTAAWTMSHTWTATGTQAVQKAGMFNNASVGSGTMVFEAGFTQVSLVATDTLTITWTVNI